MPPDINLILRIQKLERLAASNPNKHEAAAAKAKAEKLRAQLPKDAEEKYDWGKAPKEMPNINLWPVAPAVRRPTRAAVRPSKSGFDLRIEELQNVMHRLSASGQIFAADLCAQFYTKGFLTNRQWQCVDELVEEAD
jgi:hypothetical protein